MKDAKVLSFGQGNCKSNFNELVLFLREHTTFVKTLKVAYYQRLCSNLDVHSRLRFLFLDAINAGGGSNLTSIGKATELFYHRIVSFKSRDRITSSELCNAFELEEFSALALFYHFSSGEYKGMGKKKTALFLLSIHYICVGDQTNFITDYSLESKDMLIPLDAVIAFVLSCYTDETIDSVRDFDAVNEFAKRVLGADASILEDVWFWGYFNVAGGGIGRNLSNGVNKEKYYANHWFDLSEPMLSELETFNKMLQRHRAYMSKNYI